MVHLGIVSYLSSGGGLGVYMRSKEGHWKCSSPLGKGYFHGVMQELNSYLYLHVGSGQECMVYSSCKATFIEKLQEL